MKNRNVIVMGVIAGLCLSMSQVAEGAGQAGGLPALDSRVGAVEAALTAQTATLQSQAATLQDQLTQLGDLQDQIDNLARRLPAFAVVDHDGTLRARSFGPFGRLTIEESRQLVDPQSNQPSTGHYAVVVSRNDVSLCAITVTAEPLSSSAMTASINGTFRGIINPLFPANTFIIVLSDEEGNRVNSRFNVMVTC